MSFPLPALAQPLGYAPRQLWSRMLPRTRESWMRLIETQDGWLILRDRENSVQVLSPQDGRTVLELQNRPVAQVSGDIFLAAYPVEASDNSYNARWEVEAWNLRTKVREWTLPSDGLPALGAVVGRYFFFADGRGLHRMTALSHEADLSGKEEQRRDLPGAEIRRRFIRIRADHGNIYFNPDGHRIYGLSTGDISKGWWNYCDCAPQVIDAEGIYGTGIVGYGLALIAPSGKSFWTPEQTFQMEQFSRQFYRQVPAVSTDRVAVGGLLMQMKDGGQGPNVISPYLFVLEKHTGRKAWQKPMDVSQPVLAGGRLILYAGHRQKQNKNEWEREWRLEIYGLRSGRRLWRSSEVFSSVHALPNLAAVGNRFFILEANRLIAYR